MFILVSRESDQGSITSSLGSFFIYNFFGVIAVHMLSLFFFLVIFLHVLTVFPLFLVSFASIFALGRCLLHSDANFPLFGEFRRFCCQKSHFRELPKSVETIQGGMRGGWGAQCIFGLFM